MYYGGPYLFERITSSKYLGGCSHVLEGPIFSSIHYGGLSHISLKKIKFRQISRGSKCFGGGPNFTVK